MVLKGTPVDFQNYYVAGKDDYELAVPVKVWVKTRLETVATKTKDFDRQDTADVAIEQGI
jgi:hypothetical protein